MTFVEDIVNGFGGRNQWPQGVADDIGAELIENKFIDSLRWSNVNRAIFKRITSDNDLGIITAEEFAAVVYQEPATEMQDWDDFDAPEVYKVEPVEIVVTYYNRVD